MGSVFLASPSSGTLLQALPASECLVHSERSALALQHAPALPRILFLFHHSPFSSALQSLPVSMLFISLLFVALSAISATVAAPLTRRGVNDFSCKPSSADQRPLVFLHGLGATYYEDLNFMQDYFSSMSYCTFSITYGAYDGFPYVGGLKAIDESAPQLAAYIETVLEKTGASQVDLIGHSEGGFMSLYLPKFDAKGKVRRVAAIAPPSHGTDFASLYKLALALGPAGTTLTKDVLDLFGCDACADLVVGSPIINKLNNGGIAQSGVQYTIITSKADELVTPAPAASFVSEAGVRNVLIQDVCPNGECPLCY